MKFEFQISGIIIRKDGPDFIAKCHKWLMKFLFQTANCLRDLSQFTSLMRMNLVLAIYDVDNAYNQIVENVEVGTPVGIIASAFDADENDSVRYTLTDDAGGLSR